MIFFFGGPTARSGPWPPLQYASKPLDPLLYLSIRLFPSFSGPWTHHPAISFLIFLFVLLHTAFRTSFFGIAVTCILSIGVYDQLINILEAIFRYASLPSFHNGLLPQFSWVILKIIKLMFSQLSVNP